MTNEVITKMGDTKNMRIKGNKESEKEIKIM